MKFAKIASIKTVEDFRRHVESLAIDLPIDDEVETGARAPLGQALSRGDFKLGNRFCILPMEGWDAEPDGKPSDLTYRRWKNFGLSGAKLIWGGEAVAVQPEGRANPNQLLINPATLSSIESLRLELEQALTAMDKSLFFTIFLALRWISHLDFYADISILQTILMVPFVPIAKMFVLETSQTSPNRTRLRRR